MQWGRLSVAVITLVQFQLSAVPASAALGKEPNQGRVEISTSLFPIEVSPSDTGAGDLFPPISPGPGGIVPGKPGDGKGGQGQPGKPTLPGVGTTPGNGSGSGSGSGTPSTPTGTWKVGNPDDAFKCNLFDGDADQKKILAAINVLNQAVSSPTCGNGVSLQAVTDNNKKITDAVTALNGYLDKPETATADKYIEIVNNVDNAIRAANTLANTFANADIFNKQCRDQMQTGDIALRSEEHTSELQSH